MSEAEMTEFLNQQAEKDNNAYFIAFVGEEIAGVLHLTADYHYRVRHIAELFIAVAQDFQGYGIGSILLEDALDWIKEVGIIKRLELTVQACNHKARHLYEKFDFAFVKWILLDGRSQKYVERYNAVVKNYSDKTIVLKLSLIHISEPTRP